MENITEYLKGETTNVLKMLISINGCGAITPPAIPTHREKQYDFDGVIVILVYFTMQYVYFS